MIKILSILTILMMGVHMIRPLGLPGLRRRADFWKIALMAMIALGITVLLSHGT